MGGRWYPWGTIRIKICNHPTSDQPLTWGADFPGNPNSSLAIGQPGNLASSLLSFYFLGWLPLWRAAGSKWRRLRSIFSIFCRIGLSVCCIEHFISSIALLTISAALLNKSHKICHQLLQVALQSDLKVSFSIDNFDPTRFHDIHCLLYAGAALLYAVKTITFASKKIQLLDVKNFNLKRKCNFYHKARVAGGEGRLTVPCGVITHAGRWSSPLS